MPFFFRRSGSLVVVLGSGEAATVYIDRSVYIFRGVRSKWRSVVAYGILSYCPPGMRFLTIRCDNNVIVPCQQFEQESSSFLNHMSCFLSSCLPLLFEQDPEARLV